MALLFVDSFDHYATGDISEKWTSTSGGQTIDAGQGRRGTAAIRFSMNAGQYFGKSVQATGSTAIVGFAYKPTAIPTVFMAISDSIANKENIYVTHNSDGTLSVFATAGQIQLGRTTATIPLNLYTYIEIKAVFHDTAGSVVVRFNGGVVLTIPVADTANTTVAWNTVSFVSGAFGGPNFYFDDLYICDGSGPAPRNDFLGDIRVDARVPTGAGTSTGWTPSAGANWQCVDDAVPNDDTDYTQSSTVGATDTFVVQDAPSVGATILGVQHCLSLKKADAGLSIVVPVVRVGGTVYEGTAVATGTSYAFGTQMMPTDPSTGASWTEVNFNAAEFGYRKNG